MGEQAAARTAPVRGGYAALERLAFSVPEIAESTGVSDQSIYREISEGRLRARKIRGRVVVTRQALEEWLGGDAA